MSGFVKLFRGFKDWEWYDDIPTKVVFIHLLLEANYKPSRYRGYEIPAGSLVSGYDALSSQTGLTVKQIRRAIKNLKSTGEVASKKTNKFSIISITKWSEYQEQGRQGAGKGQSEGTQRAASKEGKKGRREEKKDIPRKKYTPEFEDIWKAYEPHGVAKGDKQSASKFYQSAIKEGVSHEEIIGAIKQYCSSCKANDSYTKHLSRWLDKRGWEGHFAINPRAAKQSEPSYADRLIAAASRANEAIQPVVQGREWDEAGCGNSQAQIDGRTGDVGGLLPPASPKRINTEIPSQVGNAQAHDGR